VHNELITRNGIFNHETLDFSELIADGIYESVHMFAPLRIKGATGSARPPIAVTRSVVPGTHRCIAATVSLGSMETPDARIA
jgi:hypothetical protein